MNYQRTVRRLAGVEASKMHGQSIKSGARLCVLVLLMATLADNNRRVR